MSKTKRDDVLLYPDKDSDLETAQCPKCKGVFGIDMSQLSTTWKTLCPYCGFSCLVLHEGIGPRPCVPGCPGVAVFEPDFEYPAYYDPKSYLCVQRCDDCNRFKSDLEAGLFVSSVVFVVDVDADRDDPHKLLTVTSSMYTDDTETAGSQFMGWGGDKKRTRVLVPAVDAHLANLTPHPMDPRFIHLFRVMAELVVEGRPPAGDERAEALRRSLDNLKYLERELAEWR